ncbi:MAG: PfkB family carbohydrate kinase [archaeon]
MKAAYIAGIRQKFPPKLIRGHLNKLKPLKALVIGDAIVDEYVFTMPKGRANKDPILSLDFISSEKYAGGILAIANHAAQFVDNLDLITVLGDQRRDEEFITKSLGRNINARFFTKKKSPTIRKTRYVDHVRKGKLFKVEYINDEPIDADTEKQIISYMKDRLPTYDLVILGDFGHGFITPGIAQAIEMHAKHICANIQTNSANMGFNYVTKYSRIDYLTTNDGELRLALADRHGSINDLISRLRERVAIPRILLTLGVRGCIYYDESSCSEGPCLTNRIVDVVGAGDAVFAITSLLNYVRLDKDLLVFLANCIGAIAVNIIGNERPVTSEELIKFAEEAE